MKQTILTATVVLFLTGLLLVSFVPFSKADFEAPQIQWNKSYGAVGSVFWAMTQTSDEGYIIAASNSTGYSASLGYSQKPMIVKTDSLGNVQWEKTYDYESLCGVVFNSIVETEDLGYAILGGSGILKISTEGDIQWNRSLATGISCGILTSDNCFVLIESTGERSPYTTIMRKTDSAGNLLWSKTFNEPEATGESAGVSAHSVIEARDGGYVVIGTWENDCWLLKTDSNGTILLNQRYNFNDRPVQYQGFSVVEANDGYLIAGYASPTPWFTKVDSHGMLQWTKFYSDDGYFRHLLETDDGNVFAVGGFNRMAWIVRTDSSGTLLWNSTYGDPSQSINLNVFKSVVKATDGGYTVAGTVNDTIWFVKFAPDADVLPDGDSLPDADDLPDDDSPMFPATWLVAAVIVVAVVAVGLIVYFKKRKRQL